MQLIGLKNQKVINLDNVSNIYVDEQGKKIIFNMNYSVKIFENKNSFGNSNKVTPDYVYWTFNNENELELILSFLNKKITDWIQPLEKGQRILNTEFISSITYDKPKNRVIFNLNYNITHPKDEDKLTSDFVFYDFINEENYNNFVKDLNLKIMYV